MPEDWIVPGGDTHMPDAPESLLVGFIASIHNTGGTNLLVVEFDNWSVVPVEFESPTCAEGVVLYSQTFDTDTEPNPIYADDAYPEFEDRADDTTDPPTPYNVNYDPVVLNGRLRMTQDGINSIASAVYLNAGPLGDQTWIARYSLFQSGTPTPADGVTFAVYETDSPTNNRLQGGGGGAMNFQRGDVNDIPGNRTKSIAVEFDTWDGGHGDNDPPGGHGANAGNDTFYHLGLDFNQTVCSAQNNVETGVAVPALWNTGNGLSFEVLYRPRVDPNFPSPVSTAEIVVNIIECDADCVPLPGAARTEVLRGIGPRLHGGVVMGFTAGTGGANFTAEIDNFSVTDVCCEPEPDSVELAGCVAELGVGETLVLTATPSGMDGEVTVEWSVEGEAEIVPVAGSDPPSATLTASATGDVTVEVTVSDGLCEDGGNGGGASGSASCTITIVARDGIRPMDFNASGSVDISDAVALLNHLFLGGPPPPCGDNTLGHPSNIKLLDGNGGGSTDLSDAVYLLNHLFLGGPPPVLGPITACICIPMCPPACTPCTPDP